MYQVYQTGMGETLESVAQKFNITLDELKSINNNLDDTIMTGTLLVVPSNNNNFIIYTIKKGDNIYSISQRYNVDPNMLLLLNGLKSNEYIYPGENLLIPKENISVYVSKEGNTINDLNSLGDIHKILDLNSKIYLLPDQVILYEKRV